MTDDRFPGFAPEAMGFLAELKANNDRDWFAAHRGVYETAIRGPAEAFVEAIRPSLEAITGTAVGAKIFRVHRDVRFSKDKSPYNTHLHIGFSAARAAGRPMSCGFYFGLEPDRLHLGAGGFDFPGPALDAYRAAVAEDDRGGELAALVGRLESAGYRLNDEALKRTPAPYPADHPRGNLLRHKGLAAWREVTDRSVIQSPAVVDACLAAWRDLEPLNAWIAEATLGD